MWVAAGIKNSIINVHYFNSRDANSDSDSEIACKYFSIFIELICKIDVDSVVDELRNNSDLYEAKELIPLVRRYDHKEAEAYLLECEQNFKEAFMVIHSISSTEGY